MNQVPYTTVDFQLELARVRKARKRNTVIVVMIDAIIVVAAVIILANLLL